MKLTIAQTNLATILTASVGIVEKRNTIPILGNVKLCASDVLTITASDLDIEAVNVTEADITTPGETTVAASTLLDIVKKLPKSSDVTLEHDGSYLHVKSGRSRFKLHTLPAEDFPHMANDEYQYTSHISAHDLAVMLGKVKFAMSSEELRFMLNGVYLHNDDAGDLIAVATDGHKFAMMRHECDVQVAGVILPRKTVVELRRVLDLHEGDVTLETSDTKARISGDGFCITTKVVDATFPDYRRVIPIGNDKSMTVDAREFKDASASVTVVSSERTKAVKMSLEDDVCKLSVRGDNGEAKSEIAVSYQGEPLNIGFNSKFLAEMMAQAEGGEVEMRFNGEMDAALVKMSEVPGFTGVVMPMRYT